MPYQYGVYDPLYLFHTNEAFLFDGRAVTAEEDGIPENGTIYSQPISMPIGHIGMTLEIYASVAGSLTIEEYIATSHDPVTGFLDADFMRFEAAIAVAATTPDKPDYSRTFKTFRLKFIPTAPPMAPYTLLVEAKRKG